MKVNFKLNNLGSAIARCEMFEYVLGTLSAERVIVQLLIIDRDLIKLETYD